jgi:hypothetical protein
MKTLLAILVTLILSGCYTQLHIVESPQTTQISPTTTPIIYTYTRRPYIYYYPPTVIYHSIYRSHTNIIVVTPKPPRTTQQPRSSGINRPSTTSRNRNN